MINEIGISAAQVLEEGVGHMKLMVAAYRIPEGRLVLGAGPVFSYYEFKWPMSDRLTDEAVDALLLSVEEPPSPKFHAHWETTPVEVSVNCTGQPASGFDGNHVKLAVSSVGVAAQAENSEVLP